MTLTVHPDLQEPAGGFAFLELPKGALPDTRVMVAVMETYGERWLARSEAEGERIAAGDPHWQSERHEFGPYEVHRHDGADWVRIGPEIVNKIEEYTPLRITVGALTRDLAWPDDVPPRAGAAVLGGIRTVARRPAGDDDPQPVGTPQMAEPELEVPEDTPEPDAPGGDIAQPARRASLMIPLLLVVALLIALAAAWYWFGGPDEAAPAREPAREPASEPAAGRDPGSVVPVASDEGCTLTALAALPGGYGAIETAIRACGRNVSADTALRLIEEGAAVDDPGALLLFGTLYDADQLDPRIENLIGLTLDDDPARAAEYYARAVRAGSLEAQARLSAICATLSGADSTLAKGAYDDYCR